MREHVPSLSGRRGWLTTVLVGTLLLAGCGTASSVLDTRGKLTVTYDGVVTNTRSGWWVDNLTEAVYLSGTAIALKPGEHTVHFLPIRGYSHPADQKVTIAIGRHARLHASYKKLGPGTN